jgi:hypothetical protein
MTTALAHATCDAPGRPSPFIAFVVPPPPRPTIALPDLLVALPTGEQARLPGPAGRPAAAR